MRKLMFLAVGFVTALALSACSEEQAELGTLQSASNALGESSLTSIEYSGAGRWYQFGQAPNPNLPWPQFELRAFTASIDYTIPAARVQMVRKQIVEPDRVRPTPVELPFDSYVADTFAWRMRVPIGAPAGTVPVLQVQPAAVDERAMEIWVTPHGFLKAAMANYATSTPVNGGSEVSFIIGEKYRYIGTINAQNQVERVITWISDHVLGDTPVEFLYSDYRDFDGIMFPARIERIQGGYPVLDIAVSSVTANPTVDIVVPDAVRNFTPAEVVNAERIGEGVYFMTGSGAHSIAIEQADHIVVVEAPTHETRSEAVIAKVKEIISDKPIRYVINTHTHFDHAGGLRTYVDEGATVVTHEMNRLYLEKVWVAPRTINPDRLAVSKKSPTFETLTDKLVLTDGTRSIEVHAIIGSGHNDAFIMVYLPAEKILIEGDAYSDRGTPPPATPNPYSVNLYENIQRLALDVVQIAGIHGRLSTLDDLRRNIGSAAVSD